MQKIIRVIISSIIFVCDISLPISLYSREPASTPRVGLVLSGGGARGAAHIGVLKVFEELHVPVYCIVGTSMGSIVGGLYSSGVEIEELERIIVETDWDMVMTDKTPRQEVNFRNKTDWHNYIITLKVDPQNGITLPKGLIAGKRLDLMLRSLTLNASEDFDQFPIPFRAIASDIETGEMVVLSRGDLTRSLRASMAIPGVFAPVEIDGKLLVDGGVAQNLAVDVARKMGADVVIAVNISTPLRTRDQLDNFLSVISQISGILTNRNVSDQIITLGPEDTLIAPDLGTISSASFDRMEEAIEIGARTARDAGEGLSRYSITESEYDSIRKEQLSRSRQIEKIEFIRMDQESVPLFGYILRGITKSAQNLLKKDVLAYDIFELYKRGEFEDIDFNLVYENDKPGLLIKAKEQTKTTHQVNLGLELSGMAQKDNSYRMMIKYIASRLNNLDAQWRNEIWIGQNGRFSTEFYQPLNPYAWHIFLAPMLQYSSYPVNWYSDYTSDNAEAQYRIKKTYAGLDIGVQMGEYGEVRFGYIKGKITSSLETGISQMLNKKIHDGALRTNLRLDRLDNPSFPREGGLISVEYLRGSVSLGADSDYEALQTVIMKPFTYNRHTVLLRGEWDETSEDENSLQMGFPLGGLFKISGMNVNQIYGNRLAMAEMIYFTRIVALPSLLGSNLYAGASFETADISLKRSENEIKDNICGGSVFVGTDTTLGPIYLGYGHAEGNRNAVYFALGAKLF